MHFILDDAEFGVAEFYHRFCKQLPQIVQVTQGYCGDVAQDVFDKNQVIRLHAVSRRKRVLAKTTLQGQTKMLGIPLNYEKVKLCVVDSTGQHVGKERYLADILLRPKAKLPITVQFSRDTALAVGSRTIGTNWLPSLQLIKIYDEISILGNFINDQKISADVTSLPLYLRQMRISVVTGISGSPGLSWQTYHKMLDRNVVSVDFKKDYGNPEISEYESCEDAKPKQEDDDHYEYLEPARYSSLDLLLRNSEVQATGATRQKTCNPPTGPHRQVVDVVPEGRNCSLNKLQLRPSGITATGRASTNPGSATNANAKYSVDDDDYIDMRNEGYENLRIGQPAYSSTLTDIATIFASRTPKQFNNIVADNEPKRGTYSDGSNSGKAFTNQTKTPATEQCPGNQNRKEESPPALPPRPHTNHVSKPRDLRRVHSELPQSHVAPIVRQPVENITAGRNTAPSRYVTLPTRRSLVQPSTVPGNESVEDIQTNKDRPLNQRPGQVSVSHTPSSEIAARVDRSYVATGKAQPMANAAANTGSNSATFTKPQTKTNVTYGAHVRTPNEAIENDHIESPKSPNMGVDDISNFRMVDVCESLKMLGLGKYTHAFAEQMVDGEILVEMDKDDFIRDFEMKTVEAIRLFKFIREAHIPQ